MLEFDRPKISSVLSAQPRSLSTAFSMACARRLVNSLADAGNGEASVRIVMDLWKAIHAAVIERTSLPWGLSDEIIALIRDEDDQEGLADWVMDDALAALAYAAATFSASWLEPACDAASRAVDAAFRYTTQRLNDTTFTDSAFRRAMEGDVVQTELARQYRDLEAIALTAENTQATINLLLSHVGEETVLPARP